MSILCEKIFKIFFCVRQSLNIEQLITICCDCQHKKYDIFKKILILFYQTSVRLIFIEQIQLERIIQIKTYVRLSVKWEKTDGSKGGTKNSNKCSVFPATYKLLHLHTNFILKHLNKNSIKPSKIKHFTNLSSQIPISHPIS